MMRYKRLLVSCIRDGISLLLYLCVFRRKREGSAVLVYHSVDRVDSSVDDYRLNITPERFEAHLRFLSRYRGDVTITFDDGYGNNYAYAFPLLKKYGRTASIFLVTDYIDGKTGSQRLCGGRLALRPLTWHEVREMDKAGMTIGSHTKTHPILAGLSREDMKTELLESRKRIEAAVGHAIDGLAYPYGNRGSFNAVVASAAAETGYRYAYSNIMGINHAGAGENFSLRRLRIYSEDGPFKLRMKLQGAYDWVDRLP